ncbi:19119_t:CDS:2, partial [Racocetra persica]
MRWGQGRSQHEIECEIKYETDGPVFIIRFEENGQNFIIKSKESVIKAANEYLKKRNLDTQAKLLGCIYLGLTQKIIAFKNKIYKFYNPIDQPILQELRFNIQDKNYVVDYYNKNRDEKNKHIEAITEI